MLTIVSRLSDSTSTKSICGSTLSQSGEANANGISDHEIDQEPESEDDNNDEEDVQDHQANVSGPPSYSIQRFLGHSDRYEKIATGNSGLGLHQPTTNGEAAGFDDDQDSTSEHHEDLVENEQEEDED